MRSASPRGQYKRVTLGKSKAGIGDRPPPMINLLPLLDPLEKTLQRQVCQFPFLHIQISLIGRIYGWGYGWKLGICGNQKREHCHIKVNSHIFRHQLP